MRQSHPELNFRLGKGRIRERRKAFSRDSLAATCEFLGMSADDTSKFLAETDAIRATEILTCVDCGKPIETPTSDPFRCKACRVPPAGRSDTKE